MASVEKQKRLAINISARTTLGVSGKNSPLEKTMKAIRRFITLVFIGHLDLGKQVDALMPFLQDRWGNFIAASCWITTSIADVKHEVVIKL